MFEIYILEDKNRQRINFTEDTYLSLDNHSKIRHTGNSLINVINIFLSYTEQFKTSLIKHHLYVLYLCWCNVSFQKVCAIKLKTRNPTNQGENSVLNF